MHARVDNLAADCDRLRTARVGTLIWSTAVGLLATATLLVSCANSSVSPSIPKPTDALAVELDRRLEADIRPLLKAYCFECHGAAKTKGDIRLDSISTLHDAVEASADLEKVREMIRTREMPPNDQPEKPRPTEHERLILEQWLDAVLEYVPPDAETDPGWFTIHRLNKSEYRNTMRDLLGIQVSELDVAGRLPQDDTGYGFDNNADVLTMSPLALEQYMDSAERAIELSLGPIVEIGDRPVPLSLQLNGSGNNLGGGVYLFSRGSAEARFVFPATGEYIIRISAWENKGGEEHALMSLRIDGKALETFGVSGTLGDPEDFTLAVRVKAGERLVSAHFTNDYYVPEKADRNMAVESITIAGPLDEATTERGSAWKDVIGFASVIENEDARAAEIIERFGERAYRRPLDAQERESLTQLYQSQRTHEFGFEQAVRVTLTAMLTSPNFLYRSLNNPASGDATAIYQLNNYELASRMSYFLWSSMPDEALLTLAASGSLSSPDILREQVRRMIADPRADAFIENFAGQWLQLRTLDGLAMDKSRFPEYDDTLRTDMVKEASLYFGDVVRGGGSVLALVNSDYSFLNDRMATLYGIDGIEGDAFRRVDLPAGSHRGGVLTMAGVLTVTSNTTRTSPVKRGLFVLDQFLGTPPPPPPADIPPLEQTTKTHPNATLREQLATHVANPSCAVCHNRLDPIGLAFENFDAIGRWRDAENGVAIDASGTLPGGVRLSGYEDLKNEVLARSDQFVETLSAKVMTYAIGRGLEPFDRPAVRLIANQVKENGNRFDALIEAVVLSDTFRKCRGRGRKDE